MDAKLVVVVCGKTDVMDEWKQNVQRPKILDGYFFLTANSIGDDNVISENLNRGRRVVLFLSLQDLQGEIIKDRHKELFRLNESEKIDLLIIDETHFAARGKELGKVLNLEEKAYDISLNNFLKNTKSFKPKVCLHLSGTPYRILLDGEFEEQDIIAKVRYEDIAKSKEDWDRNNPDADEWDNPYYGFPQMIRFAFYLTDSSRQLLERLQKTDVKCGLSDLFRTYSLNKTGRYNEFKYKEEVLELLQAIDGTKEDKNIFSFLKYDKIQNGKMCRHIVMVLPWRASCDAMERILKENQFNLLNDYDVINIAGLDTIAEFDSSNPNHVENAKQYIAKCEQKDKKTITLTVGRMLTGCTVPEWDTMIMLRNTNSPELYDQAIYRLQSQYIKTVKSNHGGFIKQNMKPQTLLVDFDPMRMFQLQHKRALISEINDNERGYVQLQQQISKELVYSPIICINHDKLQQVEACDITDAIRQYNNNKSILDETEDISIDEKLIHDAFFCSLLDRENEIDSKVGIFTTKPYNGKNKDDIDNDGNPVTSKNQPSTPQQSLTRQEDDTTKSLQKKMKTLYFKVLLYTFLSDHQEKSLSEVFQNILHDKESRRIANNIQLDVSLLKTLLLKVNPFVLNELEHKIFNISDLSSDKKIEVHSALKRIARISNSEVVTPEWITKEMVELLPSHINAKSRFLNIAGKTGEFEYALLQKYDDEVKRNIYTIPTSSVTYECTRKMFKLMGIPISNIIYPYHSQDLILLENKAELIKKIKNMKFDAIVGNPPYHENISESKANSSLSKQLYPSFIQLIHELDVSCASLITPSRWFKAEAQDKSFVKLRDYIKNNNHIHTIVHFPNGNEVFPTTIIKGGVNYFLYKRGYKGNVRFYNNTQGNLTEQQRPLFEKDMDIIFEDCQEYEIIKKVTSRDFEPLTKITTGRNAFGIIGRPDVVAKVSVSSKTQNGIKLRCKNNVIRWTLEEHVTKSKDLLNKYKVFISKSAGDPATDCKIIGQAYVAGPREACTDSLIPIGGFNTLEEAENLQKYLSTKFLRYLVSILKVSQNVTQIVYQYVPIQDFTSSSDIKWNQSIKEIDNQLYAKYKLDSKEILLIESMIKPIQ